MKLRANTDGSGFIQRFASACGVDPRTVEFSQLQGEY